MSDDDCNNHEEIKRRITNRLNHFGFDVTPGSSLSNNRRIDTAAHYANQILLGVEVELISNLKDDIDLLSQIELDYRFIITNRLIQDVEYGGKRIEVLSTKDFLLFEDKISGIVNAGTRPRYREVEINIEDMDDCQEIMAKFDRIVEQATFNTLRMHSIIYYGEVVSEATGIASFNKDPVYPRNTTSCLLWAYGLMITPRKLTEADGQDSENVW